jgi:hypothetical protein
MEVNIIKLPAVVGRWPATKKRATEINCYQKKI